MIDGFLPTITTCSMPRVNEASALVSLSMSQRVGAATTYIPEGMSDHIHFASVWLIVQTRLIEAMENEANEGMERTQKGWEAPANYDDV